MRNGIGGTRAYALGFSPDGRLLAVAETTAFDIAIPGVHHQVVLWDTANWTEKAKLKHESLVQGLSFSPDGKTLATATGKKFDPSPDARNPGVVALWNVADGTQIASWTAHDHAAVDVDFAPDGKSLATADLYGDVKLWNLERREALFSIKGMDDRTYFGFDIRFSPDGNWLAVAGGARDKRDGLRLFDTATGKETAYLPSTLPTGAAAWSPDGSTVFVNNMAAGDGQGIQLVQYDVRNGREAARLKGDSIGSLAFTSDGRYLVAGRNHPYCDLLLFEVSTRRQLPAKFDKFHHTQSIVAADFSPDDRYLATASIDGKILLWDAKQTLSD